jgi:hypothetical protein
MMIIRKGNPEDMKAVLELIQELAHFEKEPDAVLVTAEDLICDGFGTTPLFHVFVAEVETNLTDCEQGKANRGNRPLLLSLFYLERQNNSLGRSSGER